MLCVPLQWLTICDLQGLLSVQGRPITPPTPVADTPVRKFTDTAYLSWSLGLQRSRQDLEEHEPEAKVMQVNHASLLCACLCVCLGLSV